MYVSTLWNILSSANQFVFLSKSICFPRQINLFCSTTWRLQPCWMTFSMTLNDVLDDAEWRWWLCNFNEFGQQIHWISSANSLKLVRKFIEFAELYGTYEYLIFYIPIGYTISKKSLKNRVSGRYATHCLLKQLSATAEKWCGMKEKQSPTNSVSETEKSRGYQLFGVEKL